MLEQYVIPFLTELALNNNKDWFDAHKTEYKKALSVFKDFVDELIPVLAQTDSTLAGIQAKDCVYRIYRDVRFSNDKTPYKTHFGANIASGGRKSKRAGFYLHIEPTGTSITGGGIYMPEAPALKAIRNEFYSVPEDLIEIIEAKDFKKYFPGLWGDKLKLAPKGFPKDFPFIDLLKYKSYIAIHEMNNSQISKSDFLLYLADVHKAMYPLNRLLNTILEDAGLL